MNILILINHEFPFGVGETFLENEIGELSNTFDRVFIFPINAVCGEKATRRIPFDNVDINIIQTNNRMAKYLQRKCLGVKRIFFSLDKDGSLERKSFVRGYERQAEKKAEKIIRILEKYEFRREDQVFLYSYWLFFPARIVVELKKYLKNKNVKVTAFSRAHGFDLYEERNKLGFLPQRELLLAELDKVFACSKNGSSYIRCKYPEYSSKITTSLLGTYDYGPGKYSLKPFRIVSCSNVIRIKQVNVIAEAVLRLIRNGYNVEWIHIGDGTEMPHIRSIAVGCSNIILKGSLSNMQVIDFYKNTAVDLFVNASSSEGIPVSIMEAISFGIPVAAPDVGGINEIVKNGITGILLSKEISVDSLCHAIEQVIHMSGEEYFSLRKSARIFWKNNFNAVHNYLCFIKEIQSMQKNI